MSERSFKEWLGRESTACGFAVITFYEKLDKLRYIDGPKIENDYMEKIGSFEETVIREEIECEILEKKREMIQTAINRREVIDEAKIDAEIDTMRAEKIQEAVGEGPKDYKELSLEQELGLQSIYNMIIQEYHPQMHPEQSEVHRELFEKAQDAYRRKDMEALELIYRMLKNADKDRINMSISVAVSEGGGSVQEDDTIEVVSADTDYSLVKEIYGHFFPTEEEITFVEDWENFKGKKETVEKEIEELLKEFPYSAKEMLSDEKKVAEYKAELEHRLQEAVRERKRLSEEIQKLVGSVMKHE